MQRIHNYGSFLQAYGFKLILESLGCDVQFADYETGSCLLKTPAFRRDFFRKMEKALAIYRREAPVTDKLAFIRHKQTYARRFSFLLSDASKCISGEIVHANGGNCIKAFWDVCCDE